MSPETKIGACPPSGSDVIVRTEKYITASEAKSSVRTGPAVIAATGRPSCRLFLPLDQFLLGIRDGGRAAQDISNLLAFSFMTG